MFRDGQCDSGDINLLETVLSDHSSSDVAGDGHNGDRVQHGSSNTSDKVRGTRAGSGKDNTHLSGGAGVSVCRMTCVLLMGGQDMVDTILAVVDGIIDIQHCSSGISEDVSDSLVDQGLYEDF